MSHAAPQGFTLTVPLIKIDVERRLVIGRAACEELDKSKEIMDYSSARPQFEKWSASYSGNQIPGAELSKGNLRVMHARTVAGKLSEIEYNDDERSVDIVTKISDDNEWRKLLDGCYTGFSIGGGYLKKWKDPVSGATRYTPDVREISLVDNPCMPSARIVELVKADGMIEQLELRGAIVVPQSFAQAWAARPKSFAEQWSTRPKTFGEMAKAFDESKHERDDDGRWTAGGKMRAEYRGGASQSAGTAGTIAGVAAGLGVAAAVDHGMRSGKIDRLRNGNPRARATKKLRSDAPLRQKIVSEARRQRTMASDLASDPRTKELADAIHRKVMEEAVNDGRNLDAAKIDAAKAADQVRGSRNKAGAGLKRGQKAAADTIRSGIADVVSRYAGRRGGIGMKLGVGLLAGGALAGAIGGAWAGHSSAGESQGIADGKKRQGGFMVHAGDTLRSVAPGLGLVPAALHLSSTFMPSGKARLPAMGLAALGTLAAGTAYGAHELRQERAEAAGIAARKKKDA